MLPTPTTSEAIDYVRQHFANGDYGAAVAICGTVAPGRDSGGTIPGSRDVLFVMGDNPRPARFTVWHDEACDGALYGEW
jgi:hypothetical protein